MTTDINGTVIAIQGTAVDTTAPTDGQVLEYNSGTSKWTPTTLPTALPPSGSAGGDLSGTYPNPGVAKINGTTVSTAGGSLTTGKVLRVTGASTVDYGGVDLANSIAVTGTLPAGNQASQSMGGDITGTTASATVAKLQGRAVSSTAPTDGQVLTYIGANSDWEAASVPPGTLNSNQYFTSSGTWTCPTGVTNILCIGSGGGGGGGGGNTTNGFSGGGGGGSWQQSAYITVSPGTTYTVTIGGGGSGGASGGSGADGSPTKLSSGGIDYFYIIGGGGGFGNNGAGHGGNPFANARVTTTSSPFLPGSGGNGFTGSGLPNLIGGFSGGSVGSNSGGGGGGAGPQGSGANGGAGNTVAGVGNNASANTGAAGGGGGYQQVSPFGQGNGGNGGSGYLYIIW